MVAAAACPTCGYTMDEHNRHIRFALPDPVLGLPERERTAGTWMNDADARTSVMMQVPTVGPFVRASLPVALTGGYAVTFGVWISIHPDDLQRTFRVWWEPAYKDLVLEGVLANALPGWGLLAAPVKAVVRNPDQAPYVDESRDPLLAAVLSDQWPHAQVLGAIAKR